ncbi:hypothetical protein SPRG_09518 [Saprolegnia parasitica CBS 223.65]|uniref:Uncharacterized protein n=1 Tax=Saprolegnia parasitica (strain CBS 223.65) TaxID=695850 RepID=A0A067C2X7_SAPPC|nr:hypothetical protein SPRG_09518 [Saprolegnia parasitica CBS 223.65]KDO24873.1 hypothetical protein SPRG_09518 [Saprolegnia parasitica CBS 223.65]|eukprot:XP_012204334.1 hypothetical protein SPRG_09518 [Saprolegnia parasitica CBS 223.65]
MSSLVSTSSAGKHGGVPLSPAWACGNEIDNASELIAFQILLIVLTVLALNGDVYITFEGIRGLIAGKPVLTYAVLSGLERRKVLTLLIALNAAPSLLYLDVARIYVFSANGDKIWCLSCLLVATFVSFTLLAGLSLLSAVPLPLPTKCVAYSAPIFLYTSIVTVSWTLSSNTNFMKANNMLFAGAAELAMNFNGVSWPSGSYVPYGVATVVELFPQEILYPVFGSLLFSISVATLRLYWSTHALVLNLEWCASNGFLSHCTVPRVLTSLPLHPSQAIKIGNKIFCRPSTMALLGYASVTETEKHSLGVVPYDPKPHKVTETYVVSVYWLGLAMLPTTFAWLRPSVAGVVVENHFKVQRQPRTAEALDRDHVYRYTRGNCVT